MHTVLVVDDEPLIRWAIRESLEGAGYTVVEAGTAREALTQLGAAAPISFALLDLRLPDCDDLSLVRRVRRDAPACRVIVMTAHGTPEVLAEAIEVGAIDTVSKPFDLSSVLTMIQAVTPAA
jgi:two-component system, OmpR family, KDP operon response regulator KdpE